ncbi:MAG: hypothetical protein IJ200_00020 [Prevotella sp.]|nr:hypothetical protein [Prevotella sp.]
MANLDMNDLMAIRGLDRDIDRNWGYGYGYNHGYGSMSPYEQMKVSHMAAKRPSGVAVAGLTVGAVAAAASIGAWIFGGMQASAKAKEAAQIGIAAKEQAAMQFQASTKLLDTVRDDTQRTIDRILANVDNERRERIQGDYTISQTVTDTQSGSQQGTLSQAQQAELSAINSATASVTTGLLTGQYSQNPLKVVRVSGQRECPCDGCGCGQ